MKLPKVFLAACGRIRRARSGVRGAKKNAVRRPPSVPRWLALRLSVLLAALLLLASCDNTAFDPFQESDLHFSISGYLDGGVDTQFVRVTPVRDSIALGPGPIDAAVTLEHLATGTTTVLKDSLFLFRTLQPLTERYGHNFWSTEPLEPLATYRLRVTRSDGATSAATVTLPDTFPDPFIIGTTVKIRGIERLAEVLVVYLVRDLILRQTVTHTVSYLNKVFLFEGELQVVVDRTRDEQNIVISLGGTLIQILNIKVIVAAAGPDWPDLTEVDDETLALPTVITNVEGGVGFLGGIISKTIPWPGFEE